MKEFDCTRDFIHSEIPTNVFSREILTTTSRTFAVHLQSSFDLNVNLVRKVRYRDSRFVDAHIIIVFNGIIIRIRILTR